MAVPISFSKLMAEALNPNVRQTPSRPYKLVQYDRNNPSVDNFSWTTLSYETSGCKWTASNTWRHKKQRRVAMATTMQGSVSLSPTSSAAASAASATTVNVATLTPRASLGCHDCRSVHCSVTDIGYENATQKAHAMMWYRLEAHSTVSLGDRTVSLPVDRARSLFYSWTSVQLWTSVWTPPC